MHAFSLNPTTCQKFKLIHLIQVYYLELLPKADTLNGSKEHIPNQDILKYDYIYSFKVFCMIIKGISARENQIIFIASPPVKCAFIRCLLFGKTKQSDRAITFL